MVKLGFQIGVAGFMAFWTFVILNEVAVGVIKAVKKSIADSKAEESEKVTKMPKKENK